MKRDLVIQTSFLGDAILSLPFIYQLLNLHDRPIDIVCTPTTRELFALAQERGFKAWKERLNLHVFDKRKRDKGPLGLFKKSLELKSSGPIQDIYCLQRSYRSAFLARLIGAENIIGFSSGSPSFLYSQSVAREWMGPTHEIEKNLNLLRSVYKTQIDPWTKNPKSLLSLKSSKKNSPSLCLALGSPWPTKDWPLENMQSFIQEICEAGVSVHLIGDSKAKEKAEAIRKACPSLLLKDYTGKTNIKELVDLIEESDLLISPDSAPLHIASDLNVDVLALFGPTVTEFGFAPWRFGSKVLSLNLPCRPCHIHGPKTCPLGHHNCMKKLSAKDVAYQALAKLGL